MIIDVTTAHNENGPAFKILNVINYWCLNGTMLTFDEWIDQLRTIKGNNHASLMRLKWEGR